MRTLLALLALALGLWALVMPWGDLAPLPWSDLTTAQILMVQGSLPRMAVALLAGAALGLSGALMQAVLRNPLADPTTLGATSGAQLAVVLATLFAPGFLAVAPFAGAGLAMGLVMALALRRGFAPVSLTIAGMLVGLLASAIASAVTLAQGHYLLSLVIWNGGSLVQDNWHGAGRLALALGVALAGAALMARPLMALSLGEAATSLGLRAAPLRALALALAVALAALVSAEVGLVAFVGLAAPTLVRGLGARGMAPRLLLAALAGAVVLALADVAVLAAEASGLGSLPTGALTGLIGGPLLLWILPRMGHSGPVEATPALARRSPRPGLTLAGLGLGLAGLFALTLFGGRGAAGWQWVPVALWPTFLPLRAVTILAAAGSGALLAGAGAVLQRMTANPMAAPEVLGVTGGATLGHAAALFVFPGPDALTLGLCSALGAAAALGAIALFSRMEPLRLILSGLAVGAFASGVLGAIMASGDPRAWAILGWLSGSASAVTLPGALMLSGLALVGLAGLALAHRWLELLPLGEVAQGLGLPVTRVRLVLTLGAGLAVGAASVLTGPVSFVGLMAPHIARSLGLTRAAFAPASLVIGALLMVAAAFAARTLAWPYDLPLGLMATLAGAPWLFVALLRKT